MIADRYLTVILTSILKKVLIYFYYLAITRQKEASDTSTYDIAQITNVFSKMLEYTLKKNLKDRRQELTFAEKVVWLDSFEDMGNGNYNIATLISFLLAIITILVSSDNENIRKLKSEKSSEIHYKKLGNEQLSLFQVLLSNISYFMVEIIYMMILIAYVFLALIVPASAIKWLISISVFFLMHILLGMMECVTQMYLTFWKDKR